MAQRSNALNWNGCVQASLLSLALCACSSRGSGGRAATELPNTGTGGGSGAAVGTPTGGVSGGTPAGPGATGGIGGAAGTAGAGSGSAGTTGGAGGLAIDAGGSETTDAGESPVPLSPKDRVSITNDSTGTHVNLPLTGPVRFIAVGDTGNGDENQLRVARAMADKCTADGCDFVLLLGDNLYESGPISADDPQWQTKFEEPYADLNVPFFVVLGNHDVGSLVGIFYDPNGAIWEIEYSQRSQKWIMPAAHYTVSAGDVGILMLDTTALYNHVIEQGDQLLWVDGARDELNAKHKWVFAAAHHTYVSNGEHGNAGAYAQIETDSGAAIKEFFDAEVCGLVDAYFSGHDHTRQWLNAAHCAGTEVLVSGAGSEMHTMPGHGNMSHFESTMLGFLYVVADGDSMTGQFIDDTGTVDFERTIQK